MTQPESRAAIPQVEYTGGQWTTKRNFVPIINEAASRQNVETEWLSDDWIVRLTKGGVHRLISGTSFPLNNAGAVSISDDKVSTYAVLHNAGVPAVPHYLVRVPSNGDLHGATDKAFAAVQPPMVIKPARESGGLDVCRAGSYAEAEQIVGQLALRHQALAISPYENILSEHRVVMLDGQARLFYRKEIPATAGNGEWRHNLKYGAVSVMEESPEVQAELSSLATRAMDAIDGRFMTVDIVTTPEHRSVLEINSGVMLNRFANQSPENYEQTIAIYSDAIGSLFQQQP
jgi:ribosomal protein S6--L-glutamate ligase